MTTSANTPESTLLSYKQAITNHSFLLLSSLVALYLFFNKFQPGLAAIPGPTFAAYTKLWRLYSVWKGSAHLDAVALHKKHGNLVRVAPNHVSVADPAWIQVFYSSKEDYKKTAFYPIQSISWRKRPEPNIFSTRDSEFHRAEKRRIGNAYALPRLLESEDAVDSCIELFMSRLHDVTSGNKPIDLGTWLQYFAFDVVGEVIFASRLGFLEKGQDVDGIMKAIEGMLAYAALCGQVPEWHPFLLGNPLFSALMPAMETFNQVLVFTLKVINSRASIKRDGELINADSGGNDMLSRWAYVNSSDPDKMSTKDIIVNLSAAVFAGSDTTSIALRSMIYFLCKNPHCMEKLVTEIDGADAAGNLSTPITYRQAAALPYLNGVMKEAIRVHGSVGLLLERHVPPEGVEIEGHRLRGGTVVGINPWVLNYNDDVFPEPTAFKPERWLEATEQHLKLMDSLWELNFGAGARKCLGRHISWVEMSKVVPELLRRFKIELTHPEKEWRVVNHW
ncbi:hypothetical protein MBLNU230_g3006t2 [Neophaeotheca triangularis]